MFVHAYNMQGQYVGELEVPAPPPAMVRSKLSNKCYYYDPSLAGYREMYEPPAAALAHVHEVAGEPKKD